MFVKDMKDIVAGDKGTGKTQVIVGRYTTMPG